MRLDFAVIALSLLTSASAAAIGEPLDIARVDVEEHNLFKRKGGGGRGGGGGSRGGGSRGGSGSSSSGGSRGGSGSSSGGRGGSSSSGSSSSSGNRGGSGSSSSGSSNSGSSSSGSSGNRGGSNTPKSSGNRGSSSSTGNRGPSNTRNGATSGGTSISGSGPQPRFGGGQYYGGGSRVPYPAGRNSRSGIAPAFLVGGALAFWPGLWLGGAYLYNYHDPYRFHNDTSDEDEKLPVICGCAENKECGCDDSGNSTSHLDELVGNGSYAGLNKTLVTVGDKDGEKVLLINGTLPAETTAKGDSNKDYEGDATGAAVKMTLETLGFWPVAATVLAIVFAA